MDSVGSLPEPERRRNRYRKGSALLCLVLGSVLLFTAVATWAALQETASVDEPGSFVSARPASPNSPLSGTGTRRLAAAPDFTLTLFDGKELALSDLRGKVVVLNFWASWCPPCRAEARDLERAWLAHKDKDVVFLGVDVQDTEENARAFLREFGITYPNGQDTTRIATSYGLTGIPETFLITRDGKIARRWIGPIGEKQLGAFIEELLR